MAKTPEKQQLYTLLKEQAKFSFDIYDILSGEEGNLFFSPLSVGIILSLTSLGANGITAQEIKSGLHLPDDNNLIVSCFNELLKVLKGNENMILEIANKIFVQAGFKIKKEFSLYADKFMAGAEEIDFQNKSNECTRVINKWVEEKTNNIIKDLIPPGALNSLTRLVLLNAIYFKGKWKFPFDKQYTTTQAFHISTTVKKDVQMMYLKKKFNYGTIDELKAQVLEIPYTGAELSMFILLPTTISGLKETEEKLKNFKFSDIEQKIYNTEVAVTIPRFKLEQTLNLKDALVKMGMGTMFQSGSADLSGMSNDSSGLVVSDVFHKAFIDVNEEGTEAAAATAVMVMACSMALHEEIFFADHPFIFLIVHRQSKSVLFMGKLCEP